MQEEVLRKCDSCFIARSFVSLRPAMPLSILFRKPHCSRSLKDVKKFCSFLIPGRIATKKGRSVKSRIGIPSCTSCYTCCTSLPRLFSPFGLFRSAYLHFSLKLFSCLFSRSIQLHELLVNRSSVSRVWRGSLLNKLACPVHFSMKPCSYDKIFPFTSSPIGCPFLFYDRYNITENSSATRTGVIPNVKIFQKHIKLEQNLGLPAIFLIIVHHYSNLITVLLRKLIFCS